MAMFQQLVLDYLECFEPQKLTALKRRRALRGHLEMLVDRLYNETEQYRCQLMAHYPDRSEDEITLHAERMAITSVLSVADSSVSKE